MNTEILKIDVAVAAGLFAFVLGAGFVLSRRSTEYYLENKLLRRLGHKGALVHRDGSYIQTQMILAARPEPFPLLRRVDRILVQAGLQTKPATLILLMLTLFMVGLLAALTRLDLFASTAIAVAIGAMPFAYVRFLQRRRMRAFNLQLPYLLDLLKSALQSGHALLRGFQMAAAHLPEPMATEIRMLVEQVQVGMTVPQALESLYERVPDEDIGFLVAAVRVQSNIGSSLAEILDHVTRSVRSRQRLEKQMRTLTAQSRMSAMIVSALPFIVLGTFALVRQGYVEPLFHHPAGIRMLEIAIMLDAMAFLIMRSIAKVEY